VAIVIIDGQKGGNFHRRTKHCGYDLVQIDIAKFDNYTPNEKSIFPLNLTTICKKKLLPGEKK